MAEKWHHASQTAAVKKVTSSAARENRHPISKSFVNGQDSFCVEAHDRIRDTHGMVTVKLSIQATNGKCMTKEIACLRPHPGDDILCDEEEFCVRAVALQAGENKVLAQVTHGSGKRLSQSTLAGMGFFLIGD